MIAQTVSMIVSMYEAVGPGLLLVAALPLLLAVLGLVLLNGIRRVREDR